MNILCLLIVFSFLSSLHSQDNTTSIQSISNELSCGSDSCKFSRVRIYGGPCISYVVSSTEGQGKGVLFGAVMGGDIQYRIGNRMYLITGVNLASRNYEMWNSTNDGRFLVSTGYYLELPMGFGFNLGKLTPRGFFVNLNFINSLTLSSSSNQTMYLSQFSTVINNQKNVDDFYNFGAKLELGYKGLLHKKMFTSFSGCLQPMFINFSDPTKSNTIISISALGSIYF